MKSPKYKIFFLAILAITLSFLHQYQLALEVQHTQYQASLALDRKVNRLKLKTQHSIVFKTLETFHFGEKNTKLFNAIKDLFPIESLAELDTLKSFPIFDNYRPPKHLAENDTTNRIIHLLQYLNQATYYDYDSDIHPVNKKMLILPKSHPMKDSINFLCIPVYYPADTIALSVLIDGKEKSISRFPIPYDKSKKYAFLYRYYVDGKSKYK